MYKISHLYNIDSKLMIITLNKWQTCVRDQDMQKNNIIIVIC